MTLKEIFKFNVIFEGLKQVFEQVGKKMYPFFYAKMLFPVVNIKNIEVALIKINKSIFVTIN